MFELTQEKLQIGYIGPQTTGGRMPMLALATGLRGQALLADRLSTLLYGDSVRIRVDVDETFERGSLLVPVHILSDTFHAAEHLLAGEHTTALINFLTLLGFGHVGATSLYKLFKRKLGRPIKSVDDLPPRVELDLRIDLLIRVYNDNEIQTQLRKVVEPLRHEGIQEFQTLRQSQVIDSYNTGDLTAADEAEINAMTLDEEVELGIEKAAWRRDLAWHFSNGAGSFDAKIDDDKFWESLRRGEAFADGDRMRVHLRTVARRLRNGTLKLERRIPSVISVVHAKRTPSLFSEE